MYHVPKIEHLPPDRLRAVRAVLARLAAGPLRVKLTGGAETLAAFDAARAGLAVTVEGDDDDTTLTIRRPRTD